MLWAAAFPAVALRAWPKLSDVMASLLVMARPLKAVIISPNEAIAKSAPR